MTEKQKAALVRAYEELSHNFSHLVIIVSEKELTTDTILPDPNLFWNGGYVYARYLIHDAADKIARRKFTHVSPKKLVKHV